MHRKGTYMSTILKGAPVVAAMNEANAARCAALREKGVVPTLAVVRVGAREDDLSYEKGVMARCAKVGVEVKQFLLPADAAQEELLGVIENITSEMTVIFKEQFALIRESFQETFLELFGGGKATLELEDENAVLDCGIEIKVQPPGKALKTLSLLSGGEKAFVAIALYFAILKVHPTPFCVMDEIEAALDEPNVIRVAHYMRRICDKTQFIVITHRRGTMEAADVLYGVTMQERGVSKVLTINMNDMAKELNIKG